jgi:predicted nucleic acid-binding protein
MGFLVDTKLIPLCHKKNLPAKFKAWLRKNEADSFISSVTIAEMRYGVELADATQQPLLSQRVAQTEVNFAEAIEPVDADCLLEWKRVFTFLKSIRRTLPCEDAGGAMPCKRAYAGHGQRQTLRIAPPARLGGGKSAGVNCL